ncbi:Zinc knuckle [Popillia japonica]|uniref:Zinc knuckle n=1 Tax=Popillia japonica TaxID=7064 RepID=A0AAW1JZA0_POPJA
MTKDSKSAREQLKALKDVFVRTSSFTKLSLWRKLINLKLGVNEKLEDHFFKFDTIIRELKESGSNIDESDKVCHLLLSLPSKFDTVVTALETIPAVKIDFVKSRLLDEEIKAKSKQEGKNEEKLEDNEVSFHVSASNNTKRCYICGSPNHFQARCPQGQEGRGRGTFRRNYRSRGRSQSYRARGRGVSTKETANTIEERIALYVANICSETQDKVCRSSRPAVVQIGRFLAEPYLCKESYLFR